jgi:hypothetical protein
MYNKENFFTNKEELIIKIKKGWRNIIL